MIGARESSVFRETGFISAEYKFSASRRSLRFFNAKEVAVAEPVREGVPAAIRP
jgi:hypothetical protein